MLILLLHTVLLVVLRIRQIHRVRYMKNLLLAAARVRGGPAVAVHSLLMDVEVQGQREKECAATSGEASYRV